MVAMAPATAKFNKMKMGQKIHHREEEMLSEPEVEEMPQVIRVLAQEVRIVHNLANNDLVIRTRQMKKLRKWLQIRAKSSFPFTEDDFMRIWKGMYYHFWLSDKPLVQEELAEEMSKLMECFEGNIELSVKFFAAFMKTMCQQWFGMDQWRMDKYMMLVRRMLRALFYVLKESSWSKEAVEQFNGNMLETILSTEATALGLAMHYFDIFFEELAKVSNGNINEEQVAEFVKPFIQFMAYQTDFKLIEHCKKKVFFHLLFQSNLGREYQDKFTAWRQMGFPTRSINDLEKVTENGEKDHLDEASKDENKDKLKANEVKHLDPRAGNVDVFIAELPLNGHYIINEIEKLLNKYNLTTKRRKMFRRLSNLFEKYNEGVFPLGVKTMPRFEAKSEKPLIQSKIEELEKLENTLFGTERKLKKLTKRKRRRLLNSINYDEADENNIEEIIEKALPKNLQKRKNIQKSLMKGWTEEKLDENYIPNKKSKQNEENHKNIKMKKRKSNKNLSEEEPQIKQKKLQKIESKKEEKNQKASIQKEEGEEPLKKEPISKVKDSKVSGNELQSNFTELPIKILTKQVPNTLGNEKQANNSTTSTTNQIKEPPIKVEDNSKDKSMTSGLLKLPKILKISTCDEDLTPKKSKKPNNVITEWDTPLKEGEIEYFIPSTKARLKQVNKDLNSSNISTPLRQMKTKFNNTPDSSSKRVKIVLKHNASQHHSEYIKQVRSSPNVPYDASKKPSKGLLKPNATPGPINPFYKKKIGLKLLNDTV